MALSVDMKIRLQLAFGLVIFFFDALCFAVVGPFFPTEALKKGSTVLMVGATIGAFDVSGIFTSFSPIIFGSKNSDQLFLFGAALRGLTTLFFGFTIYVANIKAYNAACIVLRFAQGVGCFLVWANGMPFLVSIDPRRAAMISGSIEAVDALGSVVGPPLGSLMYAKGGFMLPFLVVGSLTVVFSCIGFITLKNPGNEISNSIPTESHESFHDTCDPSQPILSEKLATTKTFKDFISNPNVIISLLPYFIASTLLGYLVVSLAPYLGENFAIYGDKVGYYIMINAIAIAVACAITGKLTELGFGAFLHLLSPFVAAISFFAMFLPEQFPNLVTLDYFLPFLAVFGVCFAVPTVAVLLICEKVAFTQNFTEMNQTKQYVATLWSLTFASGRLFGSFVIGGVVLSKCGFYWTNLVISGISLMTAIVVTVSLAKLKLLRKTFYDQQIQAII